MKTKRLRILIAGILLPYAVRIPGVFVWGAEWMTSYFRSPLIVACTMGPMIVCSGIIVWASQGYKQSDTFWFPVIFGFLLPAVVHAFTDLDENMALVAVALLPLTSSPLILFGWLVGLWLDKSPKEDSKGGS
jgi:hypothetical protein